MRNAPSALIVPVSINNSWKMLRYGKFPNGLGNHITIDVHKPIENSGNFDELIAQVEQTINSAVTS
jgi:1-acyl-sn-glycerol-3-phosphate acyltransferase